MTQTHPVVRTGSVVVLRFYNIAHTIDMIAAEALASAPAGAEDVSRPQIARAGQKAMVFPVPPIQLGLGTIEMPLAGRPSRPEASARAYEFGVVSLALRFPVEDAPWPDFLAFTNRVRHDAASAASGAIWSGLLERVRSVIGPAIYRPSSVGLQEDYLLSVVNAWDRPMDADEILREVDVATLLSGEERTISESARQDLLRHRFSYYTSDLVVLTWDRAFLVEPEGDTDVADVLQVGNAQLLEMLHYDQQLDEELPRMYDRVKETQHRIHGLARRRYAKLAREYYSLVAEVSEATERVDNAVKVVEDVYLARVYTAALERFRVKAWADDVDRKLAIMRDTYGALYDEVTASRAELLEAAIVLLIVFEIVMAFVL